MKAPEEIEQCRFVNFKTIAGIPDDCKRVYIGHETCEKRLPTFHEMQKILEIIEKCQLKLTFVTPFLTEKGFEKTQLLLNQLNTLKLLHFEIVTSDWGLIHWITQNKIGTPVVSRFLTGQQVDFRLWDEPLQPKKEPVVFIDEKYRLLKHKKLSQAMVDHLSSCTLMKEKTMEMFCKLGVTRFELNAVPQPVTLPDHPLIRYSLHVPFVPLTIFRTCPENLDFSSIKKECNACYPVSQKWQSGSARNELYRIDNALYYYHDIDPAIFQNTSIDRIVYKSG